MPGCGTENIGRKYTTLPFIKYLITFTSSLFAKKLKVKLFETTLCLLNSLLCCHRYESFLLALYFSLITNLIKIYI